MKLGIHFNIFKNSCLLIVAGLTYTRVFSLGKCVRTAAKTVVVERKNEKALALLCLASGPLPNAMNSIIVPTEFAAEPTTKMKSSKANSQLELFAFHQKDN